MPDNLNTPGMLWLDQILANLQSSTVLLTDFSSTLKLPGTDSQISLGTTTPPLVSSGAARVYLFDDPNSDANEIIEAHGSFAMGMTIYSHNTGNFGFRAPVISLLKSRGSISSPTAVQVNDQLGFIFVGGFDGTAYNLQSGASLSWKADENWNSTSHGTRFGISVIPDGTTVAISGLSIANNSFTGIGAVNVPKFQFHMPGGSSANLGTPSAVPSNTADMQNGSVVLYLDEVGNNLKVQVKYSNGTLKTATIALV